jgi:hypothetical protein
MTAAFGAWQSCQPVDLAANSVYLPARNLVLASSCGHAPGFGQAAQVISQKLGLLPLAR